MFVAYSLKASTSVPAPSSKQSSKSMSMYSSDPLVKLCPTLEQEMFATMLLDRTMTLELGTVLFKLYEELEIDGSIPDALLTAHDGVRHLRVEYLQEHWAS
ncbi:hypothetical protein F4604DRAFT_1752909 [Suillus subluteus]|nr:hypothetical protein F4604DRAFT_1752909 [Suillus subluteus]